MNRRPETLIGNCRIGPVVRVVGTVSQAASLVQFARQVSSVCDIVEVRLDRLAPRPPDWLDLCRAIESQGWPVLLTIRLADEGGNWRESDAARTELFRQALPVVSAIDVELRSPSLPELAAAARTARKAVIVSYHDFEKTPPLPVLQDAVARAATMGSVVKIVTMLHNSDDVGLLRALLTMPATVPLCVMGMGELGPATRAELPALGSCLCYGYLDQPVAPGQPAAADLRRLFPAR